MTWYQSIPITLVVLAGPDSLGGVSLVMRLHFTESEKKYILYMFECFYYFTVNLAAYLPISSAAATQFKSIFTTSVSVTKIL